MERGQIIEEIDPIFTFFNAKPNVPKSIECENYVQ